MRIVAGRLRGRQLVAVGAGDAAAHLRPTSDRVRESLFNLLVHGPYGPPPPPQGRRVLDLFAGTGALGLEALSRGAIHTTFVDNGAASLGLLRANVARLGVADAVRILAADATGLGTNPEARFDLVFLDPPYRRGLGERAFAAANAGGWLAPGGLVVWEEAAAPAPPPGLTLLDTRRYGDTMITLLRVSA